MTGVLLAATLSLVLGAVVGPEAPLIALGGGLALLAANRTKLRESPQGATPVAVAGSAAAIATIFGNALVAAVLMLEVVGFAGRQVLLVLLPCLASSGIGALIFTGLGSWSGLSFPSLEIPGLPATTVTIGDLFWVIPVAVLAAIGAQLARRLGAGGHEPDPSSWWPQASPWSALWCSTSSVALKRPLRRAVEAPDAAFPFITPLMVTIYPTAPDRLRQLREDIRTLVADRESHGKPVKWSWMIPGQLHSIVAVQ